MELKQMVDQLHEAGFQLFPSKYGVFRMLRNKITYYYSDIQEAYKVQIRMKEIVIKA